MSKKQLMQSVYERMENGDISEDEKNFILSYIISIKEKNTALTHELIDQILAGYRTQDQDRAKSINILNSFMQKASGRRDQFVKNLRVSMEWGVRVMVQAGKDSSKQRDYMNQVLCQLIRIYKFQIVEEKSKIIYNYSSTEEKKVLCFSDSPALKDYLQSIRSHPQGEWKLAYESSLTAQLFKTKSANNFVLSYRQKESLFFLQFSKKGFLTQEFFQKYKKLYIPLLDSIVKALQLFKNSKSISHRSLTQKLVARTLSVCLSLLKVKKSLVALELLKSIQGSMKSQISENLLQRSLRVGNMFISLSEKDQSKRTKAESAIKKLVSSYKQIEQLYTPVLMSSITQTNIKKHMFIIFYGNQLLYLNGLPSHPLYSEVIESLIKQNKLFGCQISKMLKLMNISEHRISLFQFSSEDQFYSDQLMTLTKKAKVIQVQLRVQEDQIETSNSNYLSIDRKLSDIRNFNKSLNKSNIIVKPDIKNSIIFDFLPAEEADSQIFRNKLDFQRSRPNSSSSRILFERRHKHKSLIPIETSTFQQINLQELKGFEEKLFNVLQITEEENKIKYSFYPFLKYHFIQTYSIELEQWTEFTKLLYYHYSKYKNTFHNFDHALTVLHGAFHISSLAKFDLFAKPLEKFGFLLAALCHDLGHTGHTNIFEVNSNSKLANRYADRSVLQSHHIALTFKILSQQKSNILKNLDMKDFKDIRKVVYECIISTDNKLHFTKLNQFDLLIKESKENPSIINEQQNVNLILGISLHAVDFFGNVKPFSTSFKWVSLLNQQFQKQFKLEKQYDLPLTEYFKDTSPAAQARNEIGFISNIVQPLWQKVNEWYQNSFKQQVQNVQGNLCEWRARTAMG